MNFCELFFIIYFSFELCARALSKEEQNEAISDVKLTCPSRKIPVPLLALPCDSNNDCRIMGAGPTSLCCRTRCLDGVPLESKNSIRDAGRYTPKNIKLVCPNRSASLPFFALPCDTNKDCSTLLGPSYVCCKKKCVLGVPPPEVELSHEPILFGLVERICPSDPIPELSEIKECGSDLDCDPRICCPEKPNVNGEVKFYCRTAAPDLDKIPAPKLIIDPLKSAVSYMQCTPPPPPNLDIFPKPCESSFDCFPNLCCQESGRRYCRPPKRSLLALVADVTQRLGTSEFAKKAIERITT
nr:uncharacterized protein LOC111423786 [Onthophagus taurus]